MKNKKFGLYNILQIAGGVILAAAIALAIYNIADGRRAKRASDKALSELDIKIAENDDVIPEYVLNPDMDMPAEQSDGYNYIGRLEIKPTNTSLPVISEWSYPGLKIAPCLYSGSAYKNNMIIAAHNYKEHFGTLKYLEKGDKIDFTDINGILFEYEVSAVEILKADDTERIKDGRYDLTLFTCTTGGQARVAVRCVRRERK